MNVRNGNATQDAENEIWTYTLRDREIPGYQISNHVNAKRGEGD